VPCYRRSFSLLLCCFQRSTRGPYDTRRSGVTVTTDLGDGKPQRAYVYCSDGYIYIFEITNSAQESHVCIRHIRVPEKPSTSACLLVNQNSTAHPTNITFRDYTSVTDAVISFGAQCAIAPAFCEIQTKGDPSSSCGESLFTNWSDARPKLSGNNIIEVTDETGLQDATNWALLRGRHTGADSRAGSEFESCQEKSIGSRQGPKAQTRIIWTNTKTGFFGASVSGNQNRRNIIHVVQAS